MYWKPSAMLWMKSSSRMMVMAFLVVAGIHRPVRHEAVRGGDGHRGEQEGEVDADLGDDHAVLVVRGVDEGLEEVDRRDADDGGRELHLEHRGVDRREPLRLVR